MHRPTWCREKHQALIVVAEEPCTQCLHVGTWKSPRGPSAERYATATRNHPWIVDRARHQNLHSIGKRLGDLHTECHVGGAERHNTLALRVAEMIERNKRGSRPIKLLDPSVVCQWWGTAGEKQQRIVCKDDRVRS